MARLGLLDGLAARKIDPFTYKDLVIKLDVNKTENTWFEQHWYKASGNLDIYSWRADYFSYRLQIDLAGSAIIYKFDRKDIGERALMHLGPSFVTTDGFTVYHMINGRHTGPVSDIYNNLEDLKSEVVAWFKTNKIAELMPNLIA